MANTNNNTNIFGSMFNALGGLVGDTVEVVKMGGNAIIDAPGQMIDGFQEGLMITPDGSGELTQAEMEAVIKTAQEAKAAKAAQAAA